MDGLQIYYEDGVIFGELGRSNLAILQLGSVIGSHVSRMYWDVQCQIEVNVRFELTCM